MSMTENVLSSVPFSTLAQTQVQAAYPARYYAGYDTAATQPTPVTAWYDTWSMSSVDGLPPASQLLPVSFADWANTTGFRLPAGKAVQNGAIVDYTAPPLPLATQAARALQQAASTSWATYGMYGETPPLCGRAILPACVLWQTAQTQPARSFPLHRTSALRHSLRPRIRLRLFRKQLLNTKVSQTVRTCLMCLPCVRHAQRLSSPGREHDCSITFQRLAPCTGPHHTCGYAPLASACAGCWGRRLQCHGRQNPVQIRWILPWIPRNGCTGQVITLPVLRPA